MLQCWPYKHPDTLTWITQNYIHLTWGVMFVAMSTKSSVNPTSSLYYPREKLVMANWTIWSMLIQCVVLLRCQRSPRTRTIQDRRVYRPLSVPTKPHIESTWTREEAKRGWLMSINILDPGGRQCVAWVLSHWRSSQKQLLWPTLNPETRFEQVEASHDNDIF